MKTLIRIADRILIRYTPDPFVIAIFLSLATIYLAVFFTDNNALQSIEAWGNGFWSLAGFTLKMVMILLGGFVVATAPPVQRFLNKLISLVRSPVQGVLFCTLASMIAAWVSWGLGLVVGGLVALEVGRRLPQVPFRIFVASSYTGFLIWHGGLSASIPLAVNTPGDNSLEYLAGATIPVSETLFGTVNLVALGSMFLLLPILNLLLLKAVQSEPGEQEGGSLLPPPVLPEPEPQPESTDHRQLFLERSVWIPLCLVTLIAIYVAGSVSSGGFRLNFDSLNIILFGLGLLLHGSPRAFGQSMADAAPRIAPILIQYPLYAAIMGVLKDTGLATRMAEWFVSHSTAQTFPLMTFYSAGLINLFVPSGGGQWQVQAPIVLPAAQALGADIPKTVMAVAWGDAWTNMAQPFWAVPLLAIAGLRIRDIIGLCLVALLGSGVVLSLIFLLV